MRNRPLQIIHRLLVTTTALLVLAACRDLPLRPTPTAAPLTQEALRAALLTIDDLPPGWILDETEEQEAEATTFFLGRELPDRSRFTVSAGFSGGDLGPFLTHALTAYPAGQAAVAFAEQAEVIRAARPYTLTLSGGDMMTMEMWPLTLETVGSDSVAVRSVSQNAPLFGTIYTDSVYVLAADADAIIRVTGISLSEAAMDRQELKAWAERGLQKLSALQEGP